MTMHYRREKTIPSCGLDCIIVVDNMAIMLAIEATGSVKLVETVHAPVVLAGCSPILLFMGLTIFLTYLLNRFLLSLLVILPVLDLMHSHDIRSFLNA